jgi:hypothetical protein
MKLKELKKQLDIMEAAHGEDIEVCIFDKTEGGHYDIGGVGPVYPWKKDGQMFVDDTSAPPTCIEIC